MQTVPLKVIEDHANIQMVANGGNSVALAIENVRNVYTNRPAYTGEYTITPSADRQILSTNGKRMTDDVVIEAIPNNYGLITWNGSVLTVS